MHSDKKGKVYLVGAGPGAEGLFTLKGVECLRQADLVIYDYLANPRLLKHCRKECEQIYVGKQAGDHTLSQAQINELLTKRAQEGSVIVRLKGGDPFVFGRGGEEALELAQNGIDFEIVSGVTAAPAVAAHAGIPLTHRGMSSSAILVSGHEGRNKEIDGIAWEKIATGVETLVFYMGLVNLPFITAKLTQHGMPLSTPVALIRWGTLNKQETLIGRLADIAQQAAEVDFKPPALIVVGNVVALRDKLRWFDAKALWGRRIVVTRSREQASVLSRALEDLGAVVVEFPTIQIEPVDDFTPLDDAIENLHAYTWIVFTSVNAVEIFFARLLESGRDARSLWKAKLAVIGKETGATLATFGLKPDLVPERFLSEGLVAAFESLQADLKGATVLMPCSDMARDVIPVELERMGAKVTRIPVYRNLIPEYQVEHLDEVFAPESDLVTFTSSSTVSNLVQILKNAGRENYLSDIAGASIGPITSKTARESAVSVTVEAQVHSIDGLVHSILDYCEKKGRT